MEEKKKNHINKKIIFTLTGLFLFLVLILFSIKQNSEINSKAQSTSINPPTAEFPSKLFAPYVDVDTSINPLFDFAGAYAATGQKYYILSFINSNGYCTPYWRKIMPIDSNFLYDQINFLRSNGGDVIVSFGGVADAELGESCNTPEELQAAYQKVIDTYKLRWIDMNIERPDAVANAAATERRNKALAALQAANPGLRISYTIPVSTSGLTPDGLSLLTNAKDNGVNVTLVNPMTMNFGPANAPNPVGKMGEYAMQAINNTQTQVKNLGMTTSYGVTAMIGQNDTAGEIFLLTDVQTLLAGSANSNISLLSIWSASRDNGGCPNQTTASPSCSGITQGPFDFIKAFQGINGPNTSPGIITGTPPFNCIGGGTNCIPSPSISNGVQLPPISPINPPFNRPGQPQIPGPGGDGSLEDMLVQLALISLLLLFKLILL